MENNKSSYSQKEPFMRISKRSSIPSYKAWLIRLVAIVCSLIVCAIIIVAVTGENPLDVYEGIVFGAIGSTRKIWVTLRDMLTLLIIAVGLIPAFKMKFWNIGAEGQVLMGGVASAAVMIYLGEKIPLGASMALVIVVSIMAGAVWGFIPAYFKAKYRTNETLFTLMMNYVAIQIVNFFIVFWENPAGSNSVGIINAAGRGGWFPEIFGLKYGWNLIIVVIITIGMFIFMKYSKRGYEISVVGESENTAKYAGINVKKVIIRSMLISGGICGLAGSIIVCGTSHTISTSIGGGMGFTAIIVAWMSKFNPFAMTLVATLIVFMQKGSVQVASQFGLNENASDIITGIILFFLIGCEFFINYRVELRKKNKEVA